MSDFQLSHLFSCASDTDLSQSSFSAVISCRIFFPGRMNALPRPSGSYAEDTSASTTFLERDLSWKLTLKPNVSEATFHTTPNARSDCRPMLERSQFWYSFDLFSTGILSKTLRLEEIILVKLNPLVEHTLSTELIISDASSSVLSDLQKSST